MCKLYHQHRGSGRVFLQSYIAHYQQTTSTGAPDGYFQKIKPYASAWGGGGSFSLGCQSSMSHSWWMCVSCGSETWHHTSSWLMSTSTKPLHSHNALKHHQLHSLWLRKKHFQIKWDHFYVNIFLTFSLKEKRSLKAIFFFIFKRSLWSMTLGTSAPTSKNKSRLVKVPVHFNVP